MKYKFYTPFILLIGFAVSSFAQTGSLGFIKKSGIASKTQVPPQRTCGTVKMDSLVRANDPSMGTKEQFENAINKVVQQLQQQAYNKGQMAVYNIPTIVHVIHNGTAVGSGLNLSQAQIYSQYDILNQDYNNTNPDGANVPSAFQTLRGTIGFNFKKATVSPTGAVLAEPGINRISRSSKGWTAPPYTDTYIDNTIKPNSIWDPTKYFNIWVTDISGGILGYAQFPPAPTGMQGLPSSGASNTDGVVVLYTAFGNTGTAQAPYNKGRTLTHEAGHFFGLRHIWGDEPSCAEDDYVSDTPMQKGENYQCPSYPQTTQSGGRCSTSDPSSMFMNYMDYVDDACMMMFSKGQGTRMQAVITQSTRRKELTTSTTADPISAPVADFNANKTNIAAGESVIFTDASTGNPTSWSWTFTGAATTTSTTQNPTIAYNTPGTYNVSLYVANTKGNNTKTKTAYINVVAQTADFTADKTTISAGSTVNFTDLSTGNPTAWSWTFTGAATTSSTSKNPSIIYNTPGTYAVSLTSTGSAGSVSTTKSGYITVTAVTGGNCDTLNYPLTGTPTLYKSSNGAYLAGHNEYGDKGKAQYFSSYGSNTDIIGAMIYFGVAKFKTATSAATIKVYKNDGVGGIPKTLLGSQSVLINSIATDVTNQTYTIVKFANPIAITTPFYISVEYSYPTGGGDTLAIVTNTDGDTNPGTAWELWSDNSWHPYSEAQPNGWGINVSNAIHAIVTKKPVANFTTSASSVCAGDVVTYTNSSTNSSTYSWTFPGGTPSTATSANPVVTYNTAGTYSATLVSSGECASNTKTTTAAVTVKALPSVSASATASTICGGSNTTLNGSGATTYSWTPSTTLSGTTGSSVTATPTATTTYTVTGTSNGCTKTSTVTVGVTNVNVSVTPSSVGICDGGSATLMATGASAYSWSPTTALSSTNTSQVQASPTATTTYTVTGTTSGCTNSKQVVVTLNAKPTISISSDVTTVEVDVPVNFNATVNTNTFDWDFADGSFSNVQNPSHPFTAPGTYNVVFTADNNGCVSIDSIQITVTTVTAVHSNSKANVLVYPNPTTGALIIEHPAANNASPIRIYNITGAIVKAARTESAGTRTTLDLSDLSTGIYYLVMEMNQQVVYQKITLTR